MRLSRGTSLDERRQCLNNPHPPISDKHFDKSSNVTFERQLPENPAIEMKKHGDKHVKSKSDRHSFYSERENSNPARLANEFSENDEISHKRASLYKNEENSELLSYYNENESPDQIVSLFNEPDCSLLNAVDETVKQPHAFFVENNVQTENRIRRENAKSKFFENEILESTISDGRNVYENNSQSDVSCNFFEKSGLPIKIDNDSISQARRSYFSENENRKSFGEVEIRRNKSSSLRQELRQRSVFSESVDSGSSRSQLSGHEAATDFAEKMLKSSRSYLTDDCCRLNTVSSAREASDDSSPGAITQLSGFETLDTKYARKRARKAGHRRQKSLDINRHAPQSDNGLNEAKSFRDFELEEELSKRLDRLEPKPSGFMRQNLKNNFSRYDLHFDSEDERCFRLSLDMERSFDLDFLDTSIDDRYGSYDRDCDLV